MGEALGVPMDVCVDEAVPAVIVSELDKVSVSERVPVDAGVSVGEVELLRLAEGVADCEPVGVEVGGADADAE